MERFDRLINPPLERWWWLDLIEDGKYPVELLPDYLKEVYYKEKGLKG